MATKIVLSKWVKQSDLDRERPEGLSYTKIIYAVCKVLHKKKKNSQHVLYRNLVFTYDWKKDVAIVRFLRFEPKVIIIPSDYRSRREEGFFNLSITDVPDIDPQTGLAVVNLLPWIHDIDLDSVDVHNYGSGLLAESNIAFQVIDSPQKYCTYFQCSVIDIGIKDDFAFYDKVFNKLIENDNSKNWEAWSMLKWLAFAINDQWDAQNGVGHPDIPLSKLNEDNTLADFRLSNMYSWGNVGGALPDQRPEETFRTIWVRDGGYPDPNQPLFVYWYSIETFKSLLYESIHHAPRTKATLLESYIYFDLDENGDIVKFVPGVDDHNTWRNCTFYVKGVAFRGGYDDNFTEARIDDPGYGKWPDQILGDIPDNFYTGPDNEETPGTRDPNEIEYSFCIEDKANRTIEIGTVNEEIVPFWSGFMRWEDTHEGLWIFDDTDHPMEHYEIQPKRAFRHRYTGDNNVVAFSHLPNYNQIVVLLSEGGQPVYTDASLDTPSGIYSDPVQQLFAQPELLIIGKTEAESYYERYAVPVRIRITTDYYNDEQGSQEALSFHGQYIRNNTIDISQTDIVNGQAVNSSFHFRINRIDENFATWSVDLGDPEEEPPPDPIYTQLSNNWERRVDQSWSHVKPAPFSNIEAEGDGEIFGEPLTEFWTWHKTDGQARGFMGYGNQPQYSSQLPYSLNYHVDQFGEESVYIDFFATVIGDAGSFLYDVMLDGGFIMAETKEAPPWDILYGECGFMEYPGYVSARRRIGGGHAQSVDFVDNVGGGVRVNTYRAIPLSSSCEHLAEINQNIAQWNADASPGESSTATIGLGSGLPRMYDSPRPEESTQRTVIYFVTPDNDIISKNTFYAPVEELSAQTDYYDILGSVIAICAKYKDEGSPTAGELAILQNAKDLRELAMEAYRVEDGIIENENVSFALLCYIASNMPAAKTVYIYMDNLPEFYAPPEEP